MADYEDNGKGAFWGTNRDGEQHKTKAGKRMFKGVITFQGVDYMATLFPNSPDEKRTDKDPDVTVLIGSRKGQPAAAESSLGF